MRAASPGREPRCSLPAKYRPASLSARCLQSLGALPLSRRSPLRARTRRSFAEPSPAFCICLRGCGSPLAPSALRSFRAARSRPVLASLRGGASSPIRVGFGVPVAVPIPGAVDTCPAPLPLRCGAGTGGPRPCCSAGSPGEGAGLPSRVQLLWISPQSGLRALSGFYGPLASCQGERALSLQTLPFPQEPPGGRPWVRLPQPRRLAAAAGPAAETALRDPQAAAAGPGASRQGQAARGLASQSYL